MSGTAMPIGNMVIKFGIDGTQFMDGLKNIQKAVKTNESAMKANLKVYDNVDDRLKALSGRYDDTKLTIDSLNKELTELRSEYNRQVSAGKENADYTARLARQINTNIKRTAQYSRALKQLQIDMNAEKRGTNETRDALSQSERATTSAVNKYKLLSRELGASKAEYKGLQNQIILRNNLISKEEEKLKDLTAAYGKNSKSVQKQKQTISDLKDNQFKASIQYDKLNKSVGKYSDNVINYRDRLNKVTGSITTFGDKAANVGRITSRATLAIGAGLAYGANQAIKLQNAYKVTSNLIVTGGESQAEAIKNVSQMQKDGKKYSLEYGKSQQAIADGYQDLVKRGYTSEQALGSMRSELQASVASGDDFKDVVSVSSQALEAFGLRSKSTAGMIKNTKMVTNQLAYAADATSTGFSDLGVGMSYVGTSAHQAGFSLAETASAMGILSNNGLEADKAGTGLRKAINSLVKPTDNGAVALKNIGLSTKDFIDESGKMKSMTDIFGLLNQHTENMSGHAKGVLFNTLFGTTGQQAGAILTSNAEELGKLNKKVAESQNQNKGQGYVAALAAKNMKSAQGQLHKFEQAAQAAGIMFANTLLPPITKLAIGLSGVLDKISQMPKRTQTWISYLALAAAAVGPVAFAVKGVTTVVGLLTKGVGKSISGAMQLRDKILGVGAGSSETSIEVNRLTKQIMELNSVIAENNSLSISGPSVNGTTAVATKTRGKNAKGIKKQAARKGALSNTLDNVAISSMSNGSKEAEKNVSKLEKTVGRAGQTATKSGSKFKLFGAKTAVTGTEALKSGGKFAGMAGKLTKLGSVSMIAAPLLDVFGGKLGHIASAGLTTGSSISMLGGIIATALGAPALAAAAPWVGAIVGIGAAGYAAYKKFKPFRNLVNGIGTDISKNLLPKVQKVIDVEAAHGNPVARQIKVIESLKQTWDKASQSVDKYTGKTKIKSNTKVGAGAFRLDKNAANAANEYSKQSSKIIFLNKQMTDKVGKNSAGSFKTMRSQISKETDGIVGVVKSRSKTTKSNLESLYKQGFISKKQMKADNKAAQTNYKSQEKALKTSKKNMTRTTRSWQKEQSRIETASSKNISAIKKKYTNKDGKLTKEGRRQVTAITKQKNKDLAALNARYGITLEKQQNAQKKTVVKTLTKSQKEQLIIQKKLKDGTLKLTTKQASNTIKNANKAYNSAKDAANKKYKAVMDKADEEYYVTGSISKKQYEHIKQKAEDTRDKSIDAAKKTKKGVVDEAYKQAGGHKGAVDKESGDVLTKYDKFKVNMAHTVNNIVGGINGLLNGLHKGWGKIPTWKPKGYKTGTPGLTENEIAVVGEEGFELAHDKDHGIYPVGVNGQETRYLKAGTSILPHNQSKEFLRMTSALPHHKDGVVGKITDTYDDIKKKVSKTTGSVVKSVSDKAYGIWDSLKSKVGDVSSFVSKGATGAVDWFADKLGMSKLIGDQGEGFSNKLAQGSWDKLKTGLSSFVGKFFDEYSEENDEGYGGGSWLHSPGKGWTHTDVFGSPRPNGVHDGNDFSAAQGAIIHAVHDGNVIRAAGAPAGWAPVGYSILTKGADGQYVIYQEFGKSSDAFVNKGDKVKVGQKIAKLGNSGLGTGPHVHIGVSKNYPFSNNGETTRGWEDLMKMKSTSSGSNAKATGSHSHWMQQAGIPKSWWAITNEIISKESGWNPKAQNPSGAYGLPQALPGRKMASAGSDWRTNPITQLKWYKSYIKGRYGTIENAIRFRRIHNWYDNGGHVTSPQIAGLAESSDEFVINPSRPSAFKLLVDAIKRTAIKQPGLFKKKIKTPSISSTSTTYQAIQNAQKMLGDGSSNSNAYTINDSAVVKNQQQSIELQQTQLKVMQRMFDFFSTMQTNPNALAQLAKMLDNFNLKKQQMRNPQVFR